MGFFSNVGKFVKKYGPEAYYKGNKSGDYGDIPFGNEVSNFLVGKPGEFSQQSKYGPEQQGLYQQSINAATAPGAGGAFGDAADYYRNNLSDDPADFDAFAAPEMRRFNEQIVPDLAEQYAGMGSGALSSSGFRNSAISAGTDLSERLGAIRANLRSQSAQGLMGVGQQGLVPGQENLYTEPTEGLLQAAAPVAGAAAGFYMGGPPGAMAGYQAGKGLSSKGSTSPYGSQVPKAQSYPGLGGY